MNWRTLGMTLVLVVGLLGSAGMAAANHDGGEQCDQLDTALDAIDEHADEHGEENNQVDRAQDECEGDHHQDQANDGSDNGGSSQQSAAVGLRP